MKHIRKYLSSLYLIEKTNEETSEIALPSKRRQSCQMYCRKYTQFRGNRQRGSGI